MSNKSTKRTGSGLTRANNRIPLTGLAAAISIVGAGLSTTASGQVLEETVVTAQKRSQSIQDVPIAIQAFDGEQLRSMAVQKASDVARLAPNINISGQSSSNLQINIRGVGTNDFFGNATGAVGIYMDEVTMSSPYLTAVGLYDMERVEVLRGPQNSLFGRNTTGGAVNYISKMPEIGGGADGYIDLTVGNFERYELSAAATLGLSDNSALRLSGKAYQRDGVWNNLSDNGNEFGEKERYSLRANFLWKPHENTTVIANLHVGNEDSDYDPVRSVGSRIELGIPENGPVPTSRLPDQVDFSTVYPNTYNNQGDQPSTGDWQDVYVDTDQVNDMETIGGYLKIQHDFDWASFTSITSWDDTKMKWSYGGGGGGNANPGNATTVSNFIENVLGGPAAAPQNVLHVPMDQEYEQYSQEFRLVSEDDASFKWVAGLYFFYEETTLSQSLQFGQSPLGFGGPPSGGSLGLWVFNSMANIYSQQAGYSIAETENFVWSPYIHTEYALTDKMNLIFGLRYTNDQKDLPFLQVGNVDVSVLPAGAFWSKDFTLQQAEGAPLCDFDGDGNLSFVSQTPDNRGQICNQQLGGSDQDLKFTEWGGKLGLDYAFSDDLMLYGSYSRGFRSGKHDLEFIHGPHTGFKRKNVDVEVLDAFEIGAKSTLLDGSLQLNAALYFYIWEDQQIFFVGPNGPDFANIEESELKGLEVEFKWSPAEGWYLTGGFGLQDTEITKSMDQSAAQKGHELPFAADTSANLVVIKEFDLGEGQLSFQADYQYRSAPKTYAVDRRLVDELEEINQFNARISYRFGANEQYEIVLAGENLTEEEACLYKFDLTVMSGTAYCVPNEAEAFYSIQGRWSF